MSQLLGICVSHITKTTISVGDEISPIIGWCSIWTVTNLWWKWEEHGMKTSQDGINMGWNEHLELRTGWSGMKTWKWILFGPSELSLTSHPLRMFQASTNAKQQRWGATAAPTWCLRPIACSTCPVGWWAWWALGWEKKKNKKLWLSHHRQIWLVVWTPLKNMKVNWDDYSQYMGK